MNKEDYSKYYIQGSDHYLIPKDIFDELFDEMINWKRENQKLKQHGSEKSKKLKQELSKYKKANKKAIKYMNSFENVWVLKKDILDILKEVE